MDRRGDRVTVRLTRAEARSLGETAARLGVTESQAIRMCVASARPVVVSSGDEDAVRECSRVIGRMGGLLNQVAHRLNERRDYLPDRGELAGILALVGRVSRDLASAREELAALRERQGARIEEALGRGGRPSDGHEGRGGDADPTIGDIDMHRIINGRRYDTGTAERIGGWDNGLYLSDFGHVSEELYRKRNGEYFLAGESGARGAYAGRDGHGTCGGSAIVPLEVAQARAWAESHLDSGSYEAEFGEAEE